MIKKAPFKWIGLDGTEKTVEREVLVHCESGFLEAPIVIKFLEPVLLDGERYFRTITGEVIIEEGVPDRRLDPLKSYAPCCLTDADLARIKEGTWMPPPLEGA